MTAATQISGEYVRELLIWLAGVDGREVTPALVSDWHDRLRHLDTDLARRAFEAARANRTIQFVETVHVLAHAEAIQRLDVENAKAATVTARVYGTAPKPVNFEAMVEAAASGDPIAIAREKAIYNDQLRDGGYAPLYEVGEER